MIIVDDKFDYVTQLVKELDNIENYIPNVSSDFYFNINENKFKRDITKGSTFLSISASAMKSDDAFYSNFRKKFQTKINLFNKELFSIKEKAKINRVKDGIWPPELVDTSIFVELITTDKYDLTEAALIKSEGILFKRFNESTFKSIIDYKCNPDEQFVFYGLFKYSSDKTKLRYIKYILSELEKGIDLNLKFTKSLLKLVNKESKNYFSSEMIRLNLIQELLYFNIYFDGDLHLILDSSFYLSSYDLKFTMKRLTAALFKEVSIDLIISFHKFFDTDFYITESLNNSILKNENILRETLDINEYSFLKSLIVVPDHFEFKNEIIKKEKDPE